jgi:hypothetical protein
MRVTVHLEGDKLAIELEEGEKFLASFESFLATGVQPPDTRWHLHGARKDHVVLFRYAAISRIDIELDALTVGVPYMR